MSDVIRHVVIRGKVQGVGYRAWIEGEAVAGRLSGWVRNRKDGTVEAVLAGPDNVVAALIARCQHGPGMARVTTITTIDNEAASEDMLGLRVAGEGFSVLPTV